MKKKSIVKFFGNFIVLIYVADETNQLSEVRKQGLPYT